MTSHPPRVAIPEPTSSDTAYNQRSLPQYIRAIEAEGGVAVTIHLQLDPQAQASIIETCSAILLPGSPADIDPLRYGQEAVAACAAKDAAREATDDALLENAYETGKPLLGICFGLQSLNIWSHGTLIQDLPAAAPGKGVDHQPGREILDAHPVVLDAGTRLASIVRGEATESGGLSTLEVNSSHHQAVSRPGDGLRVAASSPEDGIIEALETIDPRRFALAVQWHPERSYESSAASRAIFSAFLQAARQWQSNAESRPSIPPRQ